MTLIRDDVRVWVLSYDWDGVSKVRTFHFDDQDEAIWQRQDLLASEHCTRSAVDLVTLPSR